jgi:hypothetical protein
MKNLFLIGLVFLMTACQLFSEGQSVSSEPSQIPETTPSRITATVEVAAITSTSTKPPPPRDTATPRPLKPYFREEFEFPLQDWSILYASGDSSHVSILNENAALGFQLDNTNTWAYAIFGAFEYDSVHIQTSVSNLGSDVNAIGLVCQYDEQDGWYEFNISSDGGYNLLYGQWLADGIAYYEPILNGESEHIVKGEAQNTIGLECFDDVVQLHINGKLIRKQDVSRIGLTGGKVGLSLASFDEAPVILSFDWVDVREH